MNAGPAMVAEDRSRRVPPGFVIQSAWIAVDACVLGNRARMSVGDVERAYARLLNQGEAAAWPCPVGEWRPDGRFVVLDGRHELLAALMLGRESLLVAWVERETKGTEKC